MSETFKQEIVQRITRNFLDILILRLVQTQPMWGYRVKKEVEKRFGVRLRHGALYPLLNRLEANGYLTSRKEPHGGRIRKVYNITSKGIQAVGAYNEFLKDQLHMKDIKE